MYAALNIKVLMWYGVSIYAVMLSRRTLITNTLRDDSQVKCSSVKHCPRDFRNNKNIICEDSFRVSVRIVRLLTSNSAISL